MELSEWRAWYDRISKSLGLSELEDQYATDVLSELLRGKGIPPQELRDIVDGEVVIVFGAGPSLECDILSIKDLLDKFTLIAADGATTALLKLGKVAPHIIVSDLDGSPEDIILSHRLGSIPVIHAHGDNVELLKKYVPRLARALGTTQVNPREDVYNFGGFTDGDRAVFLAEAMGARAVVLAGMDFGEEVGPYSKAAFKPNKKLKLKIGKELLEWLASRTRMELYNLTRRGEDIKGFRRIEPERLRDLVEL